MRVLHVVGNLELGGGQKLTALVARSLDRSKFHVEVLSLGSEGHHGPALRRVGVPVHALGLQQPLRTNSVGALTSATRELVQVLRTGDWEVVHTHMFSSALVVTPLARLFGARVFGTAHRVYYGRRQGLAERALSLLQEKVVVDSAAVRDILRRTTHMPKERYVVIHNGIDVSEFPNVDQRTARQQLCIEPGAFVVGEIAHLEGHKGQSVLLEAVRSVRRKGVDIHLVLVGDGSQRAKLEEMVRRMHLEDNVAFLGARGDLNRVLSALDVLALPSTFEGFGIVQAEAMYKNLPVIGTNRGGATEVVVDGETGFLFEFGDWNAIADALCELASDVSLRRRMGEAGRRRVIEHFTSHAMARRYEMLYAAPWGEASR